MTRPLPSLDHWTTAFLLAAFLGAFLAPLLYWQAGQRRRQVGYVSALLLLFASTLTYYVLYWSGYWRQWPSLLGLIDLGALLFGPLFYGYCRELTGHPVASRWRHLLPFGLALALGTPFLLLPAAAKWVTLEGPGPVGFYRRFFQWLPYVALGQQIAYGVAAWRLRPAFAPLRAVAGWADRLVWSYWGFVGAGVSYYALVRFAFFNLAWDYGISAAMAAFIFHVAVLAYVQPHVFQANALPTLAEAVAPAQLEGTALTPVRYQHSGLPPGMAATLAQRLETLMHTEQLYRQPDLRLETLAARLDVSRHHLSQVLNEQLGLSFFEYVNRRRVAEAQVLLRTPTEPPLTVSDVAWEVGFNNRVSFNKAFKLATGLTPSEFRRANAEIPTGINAAQALVTGHDA